MKSRGHHPRQATRCLLAAEGDDLAPTPLGDIPEQDTGLERCIRCEHETAELILSVARHCGSLGLGHAVEAGDPLAEARKARSRLGRLGSPRFRVASTKRGSMVRSWW